METAPELRRAIGLPHAIAMVVGTIIGASIFMQPSQVTGRVPVVWAICAVWALSGVLTLFGALVCAELASIFTRSGGVYVYLREAFSPVLGFLWGWAMFWSMHSGIIAVIAVVSGRYLDYFIPLGDGGVRATAVVMIFLLSAINYVGVQHGSLLQTLFTVGKLLAIAAILCLGLLFAPEEKVPAAASLAVDLEFGQFLLAVSAGLFAYGGWHMVTYNAGETINPRRTIPRALVIGTVIVTVCYIGLNAVYLYVLPLETVAASERVAAEFADAIIGDSGGVMSAVVIFSTIGALTGIILAGPRVYYAMAQDGLLFAWLGKVHPRYRTPHRAILLQAIWASVLVVSDSYEDLFHRVVYTEWIFFGLMAIGLILLRRRKDLERNYSVWGYPMVPIVFAICAFAIVVNEVLADPWEKGKGLSLVLLGIPVYYLFGKRKRKTDSATSDRELS